jgi:hypothetical protein
MHNTRFMPGTPPQRPMPPRQRRPRLMPPRQRLPQRGRCHLASACRGDSGAACRSTIGQARFGSFDGCNIISCFCLIFLAIRHIEATAHLAGVYSWHIHNISFLAAQGVILSSNVVLFEWEKPVPIIQLPEYVIVKFWVSDVVVGGEGLCVKLIHLPRHAGGHLPCNRQRRRSASPNRPPTP